MGLLPWTVFKDTYNQEEEDGNEDQDVEGKGDCIWSSRPDPHGVFCREDKRLYELKKT